ncbi:hypothetical protein EEB14_51975 [Rhodococcus sp. WS4]|nr:hypothetical protein EEB14_51975 [Rhodococcus sp. WS4]
MTWVDFLHDSQAIRSIYGADLPSLSDIDLHEVRLERRGASVFLRFDLDEYPASPPKKWIAQRANTVQLELQFSDVGDLTLSGWGTDLPVTLEISATPHSGYRVSCGKLPDLSMTARWISIYKMSAHHNIDREQPNGDRP